jgi:hypothetical protein
MKGLGRLPQYFADIMQLLLSIGLLVAAPHAVLAAVAPADAPSPPIMAPSPSESSYDEEGDPQTYAPPPSIAEEEREPIRIDKDQLDAAQVEVKRDKSIQFDLPDIPKPKVEAKPREAPDVDLKWLEALAPILRILFWVMVAGLTLYLLYRFVPAFKALVDARLRRGNASEEEEDDYDWSEERVVARSLLKEADALAAEGQYAEAVHLLLYRSIEDIEKRRPTLIQRDWTSREIAAAPGLPGPIQEAFAAIARVVEISLFGKRAVDANGWQSCRDAYARFASGQNWQARAEGQAA